MIYIVFPKFTNWDSICTSGKLNYVSVTSTIEFCFKYWSRYMCIVTILSIQITKLNHWLLHICKIIFARIGAYRNCLRVWYFTIPGRGIGYSFQLAITAPLYSITGYCIATAQSWLNSARIIMLFQQNWWHYQVFSIFQIKT